MFTARFLVALVLLGLFASCGQQRNAVVGEGMFQKRKYNSGWHVDLGKRPATRHEEPRERVVRTRPYTPAAVQQHETHIEIAPDPTPADELAMLQEPLADLAGDAVLPAAPRNPPFVQLDVTPMPRDRDPENIMPRKRFNVLAIPSLLFVLAGIVLAFVTNSGWLVAGALVVGIVLAAISLRRIRSQEQSGKAFALIAMILGVMAALITTMVIIRTGF